MNNCLNNSANILLSRETTQVLVILLTVMSNSYEMINLSLMEIDSSIGTISFILYGSLNRSFPDLSQFFSYFRNSVAIANRSLVSPSNISLDIKYPCSSWITHRHEILRRGEIPCSPSRGERTEADERIIRIILLLDFVFSSTSFRNKFSFDCCTIEKKFIIELTDIGAKIMIFVKLRIP